MDENQQQSLAAKRKQLQLRIKVDEFIDAHFLNWLEIYDVFAANNIVHELVQLANVTPEEISFWEKRMATEPFSKFNFDTEKLNTDDERNIFNELYRSFPSNYPLRFMPNGSSPELISDSPNGIIQDFAQQLGVNLDMEVYFMYLYYTPVLKLKLKAIVEHAEQLYDFPMDDIVIAAPNFDWLIFRSMEEEWRFCRSANTRS